MAPASKKVAAAVEELVKSCSPNGSYETLMKELKQSYDDKSNQLIQAINNMKTELASCIKEESKKRSLEWAFDNAKYYSFEYYERDVDGVQNSEDLVCNIVTAFRQGFLSFSFGDCCLDDVYRFNASNEKIQESQKEFREALTNQLYELTGIEPRVVKIKGGCQVFYSQN